MAFDKAKVQEESKRRFDELTKTREEIMALAEPIRERRDALVRANREAEAVVNAELKKAQQGLFELDQERAHLARLLPNHSAPPAPAPAETANSEG